MCDEEVEVLPSRPSPLVPSSQQPTRLVTSGASFSSTLHPNSWGEAPVVVDRLLLEWTTLPENEISSIAEQTDGFLEESEARALHDHFEMLKGELAPLPPLGQAKSFDSSIVSESEFEFVDDGRRFSSPDDSDTEKTPGSAHNPRKHHSSAPGYQSESQYPFGNSNSHTRVPVPPSYWDAYGERARQRKPKEDVKGSPYHGSQSKNWGGRTYNLPDIVLLPPRDDYGPPMGPEFEMAMQKHGMRTRQVPPEA